jgi:hypothetical protein
MEVVASLTVFWKGAGKPGAYTSTSTEVWPSRVLANSDGDDDDDTARCIVFAYSSSLMLGAPTFSRSRLSCVNDCSSSTSCLYETVRPLGIPSFRNMAAELPNSNFLIAFPCAALILGGSRGFCEAAPSADEIKELCTDARDCGAQSGPNLVLILAAEL